MSMKRELAGSVKAGAKVGGQYASLERTPAVGPWAPQLTVTSLAANIRQRLNDGPDEYTEDDMDALYSVVGNRLRTGVDPRPNLYPVEEGERLSDAQVELFLAGDPKAMIQDELEVALDDRRTKVELAAAQELVEVHGVHWSSLSEHDQSGMVEMIGDYNSADLVNDMATSTPPQVMRARVGKPLYEAMPFWCSREGKNVYQDLYGGIATDMNDRWAAVKQNREVLLLDQLQTSGYQLTDTDRDAIRKLVDEGPMDWHDDVTFDVLWEGDIHSAAVPNTHPQNGTLTLGTGDAGPTIVLIDQHSGAGSIARLERPLGIAVSPDNSAYLNESPMAPLGFSGYEIDDSIRQSLSCPAEVFQQESR